VTLLNALFCLFVIPWKHLKRYQSVWQDPYLIPLH